MFVFFFSSRRRHTRSLCDWSSDVCSSDLDCRLGVKKSFNQVQADGTTKEKKELIWGYGSGVAACTNPVYGDVVLADYTRSEEHTSELQSHSDLVCRLLLEKKKNKRQTSRH